MSHMLCTNEAEKSQCGGSSRSDSESDDNKQIKATDSISIATSLRTVLNVNIVFVNTHEKYRQ